MTQATTGNSASPATLAEELRALWAIGPAQLTKPLLSSLGMVQGIVERTAAADYLDLPTRVRILVAVEC
jgi:hypothetical protein